MKYLIAVLTVLPFTMVYAQQEGSEPPIETPVVYVDPEEPPQFPGGETALVQFLATYLNYPKRALEEKLTGKCYLQFEITEDGTMTDLVMKRGVPNCPECDAEAIRVIKLMPKWIPGKVDGKVANMKYNLPVSFNLR